MDFEYPLYIISELSTGSVRFFGQPDAPFGPFTSREDAENYAFNFCKGARGTCSWEIQELNKPMVKK